MSGLDRKRLYPILLIIFTNILGAGVILPILPLYADRSARKIKGRTAHR